MTSQTSIVTAAIAACNRLVKTDRDLASLGTATVPIVLGILTEEFTTESGSGEPLSFHDEEAAHLVAELVQAGHDLAGGCGLIDEGDSIEFGVIERPAAHLESIHPVVYYLGATLVHSSETIDSATIRDGLTRSQILGHACGVSL